LQPTSAVDWREIERLVEEMRAAALQELGDAAAGDVALRLACDMRYRGQGFELTVPFLMPPFTADAGAELAARFALEYRTRYDRLNQDAPTEVVSWRLEATATATAVRSGGRKTPQAAPKPRTRQVTFGAARTGCPVYRRSDLPAGLRIEAPAIVEERETTTVVPASHVLWIDEYGNLRLERKG
jgi:N-methylhydantoinase A/oxoprolinase/acetone carboxylase beta subunit